MGYTLPRKESNSDNNSCLTVFTVAEIQFHIAFLLPVELARLYNFVART